MANYPWGAQEDAVLADIPAGKVLYKDWYDDYWKESDADIADGVFRGFNEKENAQKVVLPSRDLSGNAVTMIGERAFYNCRMSSIRMPSSISSIGEAAFDGCSLTSILIPDSITEIGPMAFHDCIGLADDNGFVIIRDKLYGGVFDSSYLGQDVVIPNNVIGIENCAFAYNSNLTSIIIQSNAAYIGTSAFYNCENLIYAEIGDNVQYIGSKAFANCSKLTDMTIPENVDSISYDAFADCQELTSVVFGGRTMSEVSSLGDYPWGIPTECIHAVPNGKILYRLAADSATTWHEENADIVNGHLKSFPEELKDNVVEIILPNKDANGNKVTRISPKVFKDCNMLYRIIMPTNICSIGAYAFQNCAHLQTFVFPNSIVKIDAYAFRSCTGLEKVIVPARVAKIGADAFSKCINIQYALFKGRTHSEISYMSYYPWGIPEDLIYGDDGNYNGIYIDGIIP